MSTLLRRRRMLRSRWRNPNLTTSDTIKTMLMLHGLVKDTVFPSKGSFYSHFYCFAVDETNVFYFSLHEEILDVYNWLRPSSLETSVRYSVYEKVWFILVKYCWFYVILLIILNIQVAKVIKERWSKYNVRVSVFGSLRTHLFLPTSDIDVLVECPEFTSEEQDVLQVSI